MKITRVSRAHIGRLIGEFLRCGEIKKINKLSEVKCNCFARVYNETDVKLLVQADNAHGRLSGPATIKSLNREFLIFNKMNMLICGISQYLNSID
ncbi:hypothetical protein GW758_02970 [Candidatus Falkowbacteria bacterium]|nr:hypothetical protein [Candidatus Falkowbacteria bacterium]